MRICNFDEFCALPEGAVFSYLVIPERPPSRLLLPPDNPLDRLDKATVRGLFVRGETISHAVAPGEPEVPHDFFELELTPQLVRERSGAIVARMADGYTRNGQYDPGQVFVVYEDDDLAELRDGLLPEDEAAVDTAEVVDDRQPE